MNEPVRVASLSELAPGGKLLARVEGRAIALFRIGDDVHAIDDVCTHDGGPLAEGFLEGNAIRCPRHGAKFDVRTGKALCFPAFQPVPVHRVELRDGVIYVDLAD